MTCFDSQAPHAEPAEASASPIALRWLDPSNTAFRYGPHDRLECWRSDECIGRSIFAVHTFPASFPDEYLSLRGLDAEGEEIEVGMIRRLEDWPADVQFKLRTALDRRYLLRQIVKIHSISLKFGYLDIDVDTNRGRAQFSMRWTQSQAIDFGDHGKLLIDTEENRYLVRDLRQLRPAEQELFMQYVYW